VIVLDTSGLLAALDEGEPDHGACRAALLADPDPRWLSPFVLAELDAVIHRARGVGAGLAFLDAVARGEYRVAPFDNADVERARAVAVEHRDLGLGLADASLVVLADRYRTDQLLTLDERHFRAVRPLSGATAFRLLPADL